MDKLLQVLSSCDRQSQEARVWKKGLFAMDVQTRESQISEHAFIVGRQPFQSYRRFVRSKWAGRSIPDDKVLAQEWREVQHYVRETEEAEAGCAEDPQMLPLPDEMIPLAMEARQQELIEKNFGSTACQWWLVEIDRVIVFQPWVDLSFTRGLEATLPRPLSHEDHIRIAAGTFMTKPKVTGSQISDDRYLFLSPSTDVRFLGASLLDSSVITDNQPRGFPTHVVAVFLGSGINCLSATHFNRRVVLLNGTHRAFTLRSMGFTHIACLVTHIKNDEEKARFLPPTVLQDEARFLTAQRPPLFKDYFDPALRKIVPTIPTQTLLKIRVKQSKEIIPAR